MTKRIISLVFAVFIAFSAVGVTGTVKAADTTMSTLNYLVKKFPHGKYWNHMGSTQNSPDKVTNTPCANHYGCSWQPNACSCNSFDNAIQCMGYAYKIAYEITGKSARTFTKSYSLDASKLRVGDIIRYRGDRHSLCVTGVDGEKISFTDNNWIGKCQIRWSVIDLSEIRRMGFSYVLHLDGNDRKNKDLDFYENVTGGTYEEEPETPHEVWEMNNEGNLNIRYDHSTDSAVIGRINKGSEFKVYDKCIDGGYLWAKVTCGDTMGWCVLAYADYIKGDIGKPDLTGLKNSYTAGSFTVNWTEVPGADKYTIYIYNSKGDCVKSYKSADESKKITVKTAGTYEIRVKAESSLAPSWSMYGKKVSFKVTLPVKVTAVSFEKKSYTIEKGNSGIIEAKVYPENATDKTLTFKSSNTKVATVSSTGQVTAKGFGKTVITATSSDNSTVKAQYTLKVLPSKVGGLKQSYASSSSVKLNWKKVDGAESYQIYKYDSKTKKYKLAVTTDKTEATIKSSADTSFNVKVRAMVKIGSDYYKGDFSNTVTLITSPLKPVVKGSPDKSQAKLTWNKVSGADGYVIYQYVDGKYERIDKVSADTLSYTKRGLTSGKSYSFKVKAFKKSSSFTAFSVYSSTVKVTVK